MKSFVHRLLLGLVFILYRHQAIAFNPVSFISSIPAVKNFVSENSEIEEMAGAGIDLLNLIEDLEIDQSSEKEVDEAIEKLTNLNSKIQKSRMLHSEVSELLKLDIKSANSLSDKIRNFKSIIDRAKQIAQIMKILPRAGEKASDIQSLRINTMILDELQESRRKEELQKISANSEKIERKLFIQNIRKEYEKKKP